MIVWFLAIAACGVNGIVDHPAILKAISPTYATGFLIGHFGTAFFSLAAVVLAITGAEALYADMGHFGRAPITRAWLGLVFPACILSYMGQGALVLANPHTAVASPFFLLVPHWGRVPMVILATAATVIASQAVITARSRSPTQAGPARLSAAPAHRAHVGEHDRPDLRPVDQLGAHDLGAHTRVRVPVVDRARFAFGMAVTGTITITTLLFFYIVRHQWQAPLWVVIGGGGAFLAVDLLFLAANLTKITHGAWLPLLIGVTVFTVLTTWQKGRALVTARRLRDEGPLRSFVTELHDRTPPLQRVSGTAVFLNRGSSTTPLAMRANVEHNHILHEHVVILSVDTLPVPHVAVADRIVVDDLGFSDDGITHVAARFGYMDEPNVPRVLALAAKAGLECPLEVDEASYFLSTIELHVGTQPGMSRWRKHLFVATSRITADAAEYFGLPRYRTVIMGSRVEV